MNIKEFTILNELKLDISWYERGKQFHVKFENVEIKDGSFLISDSGRHFDRIEAINDYIKNIRGKIIVYCAYSKNARREIIVPDDLEFYTKKMDCVDHS